MRVNKDTQIAPYAFGDVNLAVDNTAREYALFAAQISIRLMRISKQNVNQFVHEDWWSA